MKLSAFAATDIGCHRSENEDCSLCDEKLRVFAVADGIGGLPAGAQASAAAITILAGWFRKHPAAATADYADALRETNDAVFFLGSQLSPLQGIGTTLTLAHFGAGVFHIVHVGDSSMFAWRTGELTELTTEHNVGNDRKARAARGEPVHFYQGNLHALTRCVGQPPPLDGDITEHAYGSGDRFLVCTDGITRCITAPEIGEYLAEAETPEAAATLLVELARERGGLDNATAIVIFAE